MERKGERILGKKDGKKKNKNQYTFSLTSSLFEIQIDLEKY